MDWNLKAPSWGFTESTHKSFPDIDEVGGGSSSLGTNEVKRDFSVDLKLGHVSNPLNIEQEAREWKVETLVSRKASSALVSMKRPRGSNNGAQPVSCLVDGCYADLSNCRGTTGGIRFASSTPKLQGSQSLATGSGFVSSAASTSSIHWRNLMKGNEVAGSALKATTEDGRNLSLIP